jgi:hypothetical protein
MRGDNVNVERLLPRAALVLVLVVLGLLLIVTVVTIFGLRVS